VMGKEQYFMISLYREESRSFLTRYNNLGTRATFNWQRGRQMWWHSASSRVC